MGSLCSCFDDQPSYNDVSQSSSTQGITPDQETRRQQILAAAMKRQADEESRGIKNVDAYKSKIRQREKYENGNTGFSGQGGGLKWSVN